MARKALLGAATEAFEAFVQAQEEEDPEQAEALYAGCAAQLRAAGIVAAVVGVGTTAKACALPDDTLAWIDEQLPFPILVVHSSACVSLAASLQERLEVQGAACLYAEAVRAWQANASALLNLGHLWRERGQLPRAMCVYRQALRTAAWAAGEWEGLDMGQEQGECVAAAAYHLCVLLHQLGRGGRREAQGLLRRFGARLRLGDALWRPGGCSDTPFQEGKAQAEAAGRGEGAALGADQVRLYRNAVPPALGAVLRGAFGPEAPFWEQTDYAERGFYSFWYDVEGHTPQNTVEQLIEHLLPFTGLGEAVVGAEWWCHTRAGNSMGHQLHYDTDERTFEETGVLHHPAISTVVYLSTQQDDTGGGEATVVLDQGVDSVTPATRAWVSRPVQNSVLFFKGDRLHGVLPRPAQEVARPPPDDHRLTLMIGWWTREGSTGRRRLLGSMGAVPRPSRACTWPSLLPTITIPTDSTTTSDDAGSTSRRRSRRSGCSAPLLVAPERVWVEERSPAWESVAYDHDDQKAPGAEAGGNDDDNMNTGSMEIPCEADRSFFVRDNSVHRQRVLEGHGLGAECEGDQEFLDDLDEGDEGDERC